MRNSTTSWLLVFLLLPALGNAQSSISLRSAVEQAQKNYPTVQVSQAQVDTAIAGIRLARTSYLPRLDSLTQVNRATRNNIYGMLLQQPVISPISGPPVLENSTASVFGSAVGILLDWEPFDFGLRRSRVDLAERARRRADATVARTEFEAGVAAADAYLTLLAAQETVKAARASVERNEVLMRVVESLVQAQLRPGADATLTRAELASSQVQMVRAEQAVAEAKALLAGLIGSQPHQVSITEGRLLQLPGVEPDVPEVVQNPLAREQNAVVEEAKARARTFDNLWVPRLSIQATTYGRGSGARPDFTVRNGVNGLAPTFYNWALGFTVKFPLLDYASVRAQQAEEAAKVRTEEGRYRLVLTELETRRNQARASVEAARKLADLAPVQLEAARVADAQAQARYRAGLTTLIEVAETQRALTEAEIDNGLARLNVWRAMLALRFAEGNLTPLLDMASR